MLPALVLACAALALALDLARAHALPQQPPLKDAVVVGSGPAGLAAAITLRLANVSAVRVVEKRTCFTRDNFFVHPLWVLERMREFGVEREFRKIAALRRTAGFSGLPNSSNTSTARLKYRTTRTLADEDDLDSVPAEPYRPDRRAPFSTPTKLLQGPQALLTRCRDLEALLLARARELGVDVLFNTSAELVPRRPDGADAAFDVLVDGTLLLRPQIVIAADGASSNARRTLRIPFVARSPTHYFVTAFVAISGRAQTPPRPKNSYGLYKLNTLDNATFHSGFNSHKSTAFAYARVPDPHVYNATIYQSLLLDTVNNSAVVYATGFQQTPTAPFEVKSQIATTASRGNVLLLGDAARTSHFFTSAGVNTALMSDMETLRDFIRGWREGRQDAFAEYARGVERNSEAWIRESSKYFDDAALVAEHACFEADVRSCDYIYNAETGAIEACPLAEATTQHKSALARLWAWLRRRVVW